MDGIIATVLMVAGLFAIFTLPAAVWALIGYGATCRRLEERNAAQAQTIAQLMRPAGPLDYVIVGDKRVIGTGIERVEDIEG